MGWRRNRVRPRPPGRRVLGENDIQSDTFRRERDKTCQFPILLQTVLALVAKAHQEGIVESRYSRFGQLLRDHGVTRQIVVKALDSGS